MNHRDYHFAINHQANLAKHRSNDFENISIFYLILHRWWGGRWTHILGTGKQEAPTIQVHPQVVMPARHRNPNESCRVNKTLLKEKKHVAGYHLFMGLRIAKLLSPTFCRLIT